MSLIRPMGPGLLAPPGMIPVPPGMAPPGRYAFTQYTPLPQHGRSLMSHRVVGKVCRTEWDKASFPPKKC